MGIWGQGGEQGVWSEACLEIGYRPRRWANGKPRLFWLRQRLTGDNYLYFAPQRKMSLFVLQPAQ